MSELDDSTRDAAAAETAAVFGSSAEAPLGWFGEFALQAEIGTDGPFTLYRARQPRLNRTVMLKLPTARHGIGENVPWFLRREAEVTSLLDHPAIPRVLESGELVGVPFLAFSAVDGVSLATHLRRGPVPPKQALLWLRQLSEAVFTAHRNQQIVHANLRPEYVFIQQDGQVRVTGFGTGDRPAEINGYLAPERMPGFSKRVAEKADVYGLGALFYAMLTGRPPHVANDAGKLAQALRSGEFVSPRRVNGAISRDLEALCKQCLVREPYRRYSLKPLLSDCLRALSGRPVLARSGLWWRTPLAWGRRNRRILTTAATIVLGIALPGVWQSWRTASAWQTLMTEPPAADWMILKPIDSTGEADSALASDEQMVIQTVIPEEVRAIHALRLEAITTTSDSRPLSDDPGKEFVLTDVQGILGEPELRRPLHFEKARAEHSSPDFPASAAIDDQPEQTGWSYGHTAGSARILELTLPGRTPVIPGEPLIIQLTFGILPHVEPGYFRISIRGDSPNAMRYEHKTAHAASYFQRQHAMRPHDDAILIGEAATRLLHDRDRISYHDLCARYAGPIEEQGLSAVPCIDPRWQRIWRQLFAIAAIQDGGYSHAQLELGRNDGIRYERAGYAFEVRFQEVNCPVEPRLTADFERLSRDGDILARSIAVRDASAVTAAAQVEPTPALIRELLHCRANYVPVTLSLPVASRPFLAQNVSTSQAQDHFRQVTDSAAAVLQQIAFEWPFLPGARLAIPALAEQLASPTPEHRDVAQQLLQQIDPDWHQLPEARRAIPGLVLRIATEPGVQSHSTRAEAIGALYKIDPEWRKSTEALDAIPALEEVLRLVFTNNSNSRHDGPQSLRPMTNDWLFVSDDPWTALNVLLELGPGAKSAISDLEALQEQAPAKVRDAIQTAIDALKKH